MVKPGRINYERVKVSKGIEIEIKREKKERIRVKREDKNMKRKMSIVLVLVMVLSMFGSFAYAGTGQASVALDDPAVHTFVNRMRANVNKLNVNDLLTLKQAVTKLKNRDSIVSDVLDLIRESDFDVKLKEFGVDAVSRDLIINKAKEVKNQVNLEDLITSLLTGDNFDNNRLLREEKISSGSNETVGQLADGIVNALLENTGINNVYNRLNPIGGKSKAVIMVEIAGLIIDNTSMLLDPPHTVSINNTAVLNGINNILKSNFNIVTEFKDEDMDNLRELIGGMMDVLTDPEKSAVARTITAIKGGKPYPDEDEPGPGPGPDSGGTSEGGSSGKEKPEEKPREEKPKIEGGKAQVELGKDAVEVKTGDKGQSVVAVKSESIKAAVEDLAKIVKEDPTAKPTVIIKLDDVETAAMEVSVPKDAMTKLIENKVGLVIESKSLSYEIPAEALQSALKDVPEDAQIEFSSEIISVEEAEKLFTDENIAKTAKVIQFSLSIKDKDGNEIGKVNKFDAKIQISIEIEEADGNPDLLGIFYINEETGALEFVGGKIKDNKIIAAIDHYSKLAVAEYDKSFSDIEKHWSKDYVKSMVAKHVIDGFEDNTYRPEDQLTRAQFAKLLVEALELDMVLYEGGFEDVDATHWAKDYIATAKQQGIIAGYGDGTFKPGQFINRSEMAAMITNALRLNKNVSAAGLKKFQDVQEIPAWAVEYMAPVVAEGLLVGSDGMLNPLGYVTRAEAATITYRVYNR